MKGEEKKQIPDTHRTATDVSSDFMLILHNALITQQDTAWDCSLPRPTPCCLLLPLNMTATSP